MTQIKNSQVESGFFGNLENSYVNTRSSKFLYELFIQKYPILKFSWKDDWAKWSKKIFTFFGELGNFCGHQIFLKPDYGIHDLNNKETTEYLVDLCWSRKDQSWLELALESELSNPDLEEIMWDFNKLMDVKAFMKVGICSPLLKDRKAVLDKISMDITNHAICVPIERYLIIFIIDHGQKELESQRIEVDGYSINYLGEVKDLGSHRFPSAPPPSV